MGKSLAVERQKGQWGWSAWELTRKRWGRLSLEAGARALLLCSLWETTGFHGRRAAWCNLYTWSKPTVAAVGQCIVLDLDRREWRVIAGDWGIPPSASSVVWQKPRFRAGGGGDSGLQGACIDFIPTQKVLDFSQWPLCLLCWGYVIVIVNDHPAAPDVICLLRIPLLKLLPLVVLLLQRLSGNKECWGFSLMIREILLGKNVLESRPERFWRSLPEAT